MSLRWVLNSYSRFGSAVILANLLAVGCGNDPAASGASGAGRDRTHGVYGTSPTKPAQQIARARSAAGAAGRWTNAPFYIIQTELSPATLFHSKTKRLSCFTHLREHGLSAPTHAAFGADGGPRIGTNGATIDVSRMNECWVLVWFTGGAGWTHWDSPWTVFLQHKPVSLSLDAEGLHFEFADAAGDVVLMPLYGYFKPPLPGRDSLTKRGLPNQGIRTWEWAKFLPRDVLMRVRYWASATREFPLYCADSFSVDRAQDTVTIRQSFQWRSIEDDWGTKHLKLAPLSPPLALAALDKQFPVGFSKAPVNLDFFTPYGPYAGVEGVDQFEATFRVLQYINETETVVRPLTNTHPMVAAARERLLQTAREKFRDPAKYAYDHGGLSNFCWAIPGDQWYAKALPYLDEPTRSIAMASLRNYFHEDVLVTNRFKVREHPSGSGRTYYVMEGTGIGSRSALGDAGTFSANLLETLWAYAHFTGDWDWVTERWDLVKKLFSARAETRWASFGGQAIAELGDEAAPCLAMARLAYKVGDMETYHYACYMFARELVLHYVKQRGVDYFRQSQPWHSMEPMDEEVYLTHLEGDTAGWQIDGPKYPTQGEERQFQNRWVRFNNSDVGRFYRDYLAADVRRELDRLTARWEEKRRRLNDPHVMPSLVQLRSLLLNEGPAELARLSTPDRFGGPPSGVLASCLSVLRTSSPTRYERLIPGEAASPFVAGLEREVSGPNVHLVHEIETTTGDAAKEQQPPIWPKLIWCKTWTTPNGHRWTFGQVQPGGEGAAFRQETIALNWNTQVVIYSNP